MKFRVFVIVLLIVCAAIPIPTSIATFDLNGRPLWPIVPTSEANILVLEYHSISRAPQNAPFPDLYVSMDSFKKQMDILMELGMTGTSFIDCIYQMKAGHVNLANVVLTFDDGYADNYWVGQYLSSLKFSATFFIPTAYPGKKFPDRSIFYMTWDEIRDLFKMGFEIGAHTVDHVPLALASESRADYEIKQSRKDIEQQLKEIQDQRPKTPLTFSIPLGSYNTSVIQDIEKYGFDGCVTSNHGLLTEMNIQKSPRIKVFDDTRMEDVVAKYLRTNLKQGGELKKGDKGYKIRSLRTILTRLGHPLEDSDFFDEKMELEVKKYQKYFRLEESGKLNKTTMDRIISDFIDLVVSKP
ncbi:MAG TPA: polysaccharide deacetylase family protein [Caldisericia bacterium]|nr:polysaccharide deacetylase family protein [Caldisericia bacterium]